MPEVGKGKLPCSGELWMLLLWITMAALRVEGVAVNCSLPDHAVEWDEALKATEVDVEWSYGKAICSSIRECYGADWLPDERMDPQLRPVEIQIGMAVRFRPIKGSGLRFPIHPFRVDYTNFRNCSTNDSLPVIESATEEDFVLADAFLKHGYNYFIVDQYDGLVRCIFGAKLKILVKKKECTAEPGEPFCSGNGHCVSHIMEEKYECSCCHGYTGNFCELVDYCADSPCGDQGNCSLYFGAKYEAGFKCNCSEGYIGDRCETHIDSQCDLDLCENNATCRGNLTHFACFCKPGFTGHLCDVDVNECESSPCGSGMCVDKLNGVQCFCLPGFGGERCEIQYNECDSNPCLNGGFCRDEVDKFSCHCALGYNGSLCEEKLSPCLTNPCRAGAHSACRDSHENFTCICLPGFTGSQCEVDINDCEGDPCQNGGTCKDGVNEFICLCNELFYGKRCEQVDDFMRPSRHNHPLEEETPSMHIHNLYIVGGTLGGALVVALCVLIGCFCRTHRTYETLSRRAGYKRQTDSDFRFASHDVSSVCSPRPSADAIWEATTLNYHSDQLNTPVAQSLKPKKV